MKGSMSHLMGDIICLFICVSLCQIEWLVEYEWSPTQWMLSNFSEWLAEMCWSPQCMVACGVIDGPYMLYFVLEVYQHVYDNGFLILVVLVGLWSDTQVVCMCALYVQRACDIFCCDASDKIWAQSVNPWLFFMSDW